MTTRRRTLNVVVTHPGTNAHYCSLTSRKVHTPLPSRPLVESAKKTKSWNLYRECTRILEENKVRWKAIKEEEEQRRLEKEKQDRLKKSGHRKHEAERKLEGLIRKAGREEEAGRKTENEV